MPAGTYRLYPAKGSFRPGSDTDLVVDPAERWTVKDEDEAGWSPDSSRTLTGRAVRTYLRSTVVAEAVPGTGRFARPH